MAKLNKLMITTDWQDSGSVEITEILTEVSGTLNDTQLLTAKAVSDMQVSGALWEAGSGYNAMQGINLIEPNDASGDYSLANGGWAMAEGSYSSATGVSVTAYGPSSHAEGNYTYASGSASHTQNSYTNAIGHNSHAAGIGNATLKLIAYGYGSFNHSHQSSTTIQYGCYGDYSAILGGTDNNISSSVENSAIIGGALNTVKTGYSVIIGGDNNLIGSNTWNSFIAGGYDNTCLGSYSAIIGGDDNVITATGNDSLILGGYANIISSIENSAILGGNNNDISGSNSVILGGSNITAAHDNMAYAPALKLVPSTAPTSPERGMMYYNQFDDITYIWNGTTWKALY